MLTNLARTVADEGQHGRRRFVIRRSGGRHLSEVRIVRRPRPRRACPGVARHVANARGQPGAGARTSLAAGAGRARAHFRTRAPARCGRRARRSRRWNWHAVSATRRSPPPSRPSRAGRDHLRFTVRYLPERQAMAYAAKRPRGLDLALSVTAAAVPNDASRVFDSVIRSRGVVLDELAARRHRLLQRHGRRTPASQPRRSRHGSDSRTWSCAA